MRLRLLVPQPLRLGLRLAQRWLADFLSGDSRQFARAAAAPAEFGYALRVSQPIRKSALYETKIHNLKIASARIERVTIAPGEIFSFWRVLGRPSKAKGYRKGRSLIAGRLTADYGGGLCQLSGIIYHAAVLAGLAVVERHNHSVDIYTEEERFAPLGTDATVVYGYRDLRIRNNYGFAICYRFEIDDDGISCALKSTEPIAEGRLVLERTASRDGQEVVMKRLTGGGETVVARSFYKNQA